jgi:hypothetical protein
MFGIASTGQLEEERQQQRLMQMHESRNEELIKELARNLIASEKNKLASANMTESMRQRVNLLTEGFEDIRLLTTIQTVTRDLRDLVITIQSGFLTGQMAKSHDQHSFTTGYTLAPMVARMLIVEPIYQTTWTTPQFLPTGYCTSLSPDGEGQITHECKPTIYLHLLETRAKIGTKPLALPHQPPHPSVLVNVPGCDSTDIGGLMDIPIFCNLSEIYIGWQDISFAPNPEKEIDPIEIEPKSLKKIGRINSPVPIPDILLTNTPQTHSEFPTALVISTVGLMLTLLHIFARMAAAAAVAMNQLVEIKRNSVEH